MGYNRAMIDQPKPNPLAPASRRASGRRTWLWAALAFLGLSICSLVTVALAVSGGQLPELGNGPSWTPSAAEGNSQPQGSSSLAASLTPGDQVVNASSSRVRLRKTPGFQNKPGDDIIATVPSGAVGEVVDGPQEVDGLRWWLVRFSGQNGWMAERTSQGVLLLDRTS